MDKIFLFKSADRVWQFLQKKVFIDVFGVINIRYAKNHCFNSYARIFYAFLIN